MIKGIAHIAFNVLDMDKAIAFYCDVLGFEMSSEIYDDRNNPWITYIKVTDNQFIELFDTRNETLKDRPSIGYSHLCLEVEDIFQIEKHLLEHNVHIDVKPLKAKDGNYQCWIKDPDGNKIEFMQLC